MFLNATLDGLEIYLGPLEKYALPPAAQFRFKIAMPLNVRVRRGTAFFFDLRRRYKGLDEKGDPLVAIAAIVP
jgi:hypothetical protein